MNYLVAENISKAYGEKELFSNLTLGISAGQKVALVAKNGSGKTSLLNIMAGLDTPDSGQVTSRNGLKVAYLPQNPSYPDDFRVMDVIFYSGSETSQTVLHYENCVSALGKENTVFNQQQLNEAIIQMDRLKAWDYEARVKEILSRFSITILDQKFGKLSGGQQKKVALARVLIDECDLLIMDEPTNHLDIEMIIWLEEFLSRAKLSLLLVTHDRYFLDSVCNEIVELDRKKLHRYRGSYSYFLEKKAEREMVENKEMEKVNKYLEKELEWLKRSPQARTTKSRARINAAHELEEKAGHKLHEDAKALKVKTERIGGKILEINNIRKTYGDIVAVEDYSYTFKKGEKIGIVGNNGSGKTTFLNLITEKIKADRGRVSKGQTITFGYFSQEGYKTNEDKRVINIVTDIAEVIQIDKGYMSASQFLTHFGISRELQYSYYSTLSGGEKRKLYLLMTLMQNPNFLILDEPTNDLDIHTLNLLEDFLVHYPGCLIIVSHDRYFMDKIVDHLFIFRGEGKIKDFYGNYTEFRINEAIEQKALASKAKPQQQKLKETKAASSKPTYKQKMEHQQLETEIVGLELEKEDLLQKLNEGENNPDKLTEYSVRIGEILDEIDKKTTIWMELDDIINS